MKAFNRIFLGVIMVIVLMFIGSNIAVLNLYKDDTGRPYKVEIARLSTAIEQNGGLSESSLSQCDYVTNVSRLDGKITYAESDYAIREINGKLYRFDYITSYNATKPTLIAVNVILGVMSLIILGVMIYLKKKILKPFENFSDVPYQLSKGNLTAPVKETKNRFFGKFIWGVDMLRENMEQQKERELNLQKERKTLLLSLSHDIKTPLSAIKLYSKALSKGLYDSRDKQLEIADNINKKADEIEGYVTKIITASREDFLSFDVKAEEFYLSSLAESVSKYYTEKLSLIKIDFSVGRFSDCLIKGDLERSIEVLQNLVENAIKYGDGKFIGVEFSEEDGCILITVKNSGCTLPDSNLPHIFDSFWRGENAAKEKGSGLGLYICRQLMTRMDGDIFAQISDGCMLVTAVFSKA